VYDPLIKALNCALDRLSKVDVDGLPEFKKDRQIVFARSNTKCIETETYLQGSYKPDIILIKWRKFKTEYEYEDYSYLESYISDICCRPGRDEPPLSWRNILSTVEVRRDDSGSVGSEGKSAPQKIIVDEYPMHRCVSVSPLLPPHSHQLQSGHALAREVKVSHLGLRIGRSHHERGAENCTKPTDSSRRGPGAMGSQSLAGSASRGRSRTNQRQKSRRDRKRKRRTFKVQSTQARKCHLLSTSPTR